MSKLPTPESCGLHVEDRCFEGRQQTRVYVGDGEWSEWMDTPMIIENCHFSYAKDTRTGAILYVISEMLKDNSAKTANALLDELDIVGRYVASTEDQAGSPSTTDTRS